MTQIASAKKYIQIEETQFKAAVSESLAQKLGGTMNWILDHIIIPPGTVADFGHATPPSGWLLCDGSVVSQATYADLFAAIGTTWNTGGEGAGNFRLPDATGRYARGSGGGKTTGQTLAAALPSHTHGFTAVRDLNTGVADGGATYGLGAGTTASGGSVGDGTEVRPASIVFTKIIKT